MSSTFGYAPKQMIGHRSSVAVFALALLTSDSDCSGRGLKDDVTSLGPVLLSGCLRRPTGQAGRACEVEGPTTLVLWLPEDDREALGLESPGPGTSANWRTVEGGRQATIELSGTATTLHLTRGRRRVWSLSILERARLSVIKEADDSRRRGDLQRTRRLVDSLRGALLDEREVAELAALVARLAMASGESADAIELFGRSSRSAAQAGLPVLATNELLTAGWLHLIDWRVSEAKAVLDRAADLLHPEDAEGAVHLLYYRGLVAEQRGDLTSALRLLERSERFARRVGLASSAMTAAQRRALVLASAGMTSASLSILEAELVQARKQPRSCAHAWMLSSKVWVLVMAREMGLRPRESAIALGLKASALYEEHCHDRVNHESLLADLALAHAQDGRIPESRTWLRRLESLGPRPTTYTELWLRDLKARLELLEGRPRRALEQYRRLTSRAELLKSPMARWRGLVGESQALEKLDRLDDAIDRLRRAEKALDLAVGEVALGGPRTRFVTIHGRSADSLFELLHRRGRAREAIEALRRASARFNQSLAVGARLSELSTGERRQRDQALDRYHKARQEMEALMARSWGRAESKQSSTTRRLKVLGRAASEAIQDALAIAGPTEIGLRPLAEGEVLGGSLLIGQTRYDMAQTPEEALIVAARKGEGLAAGLQLMLEESSRVFLTDFARPSESPAEPWQEAALRTGAVSFLVEGVSLRSNPSVRRLALVVSDPLGDLPRARDATREVVARLLADGFEIVALEGDAVTRGHLEAALRDATYFHYAGHAGVEDLQHWGRGIPLHDGTWFTVADILALSSGPERVVLLGCGTAAVASEHVGLGLAHAFVLRGAQEVVASTRAISDDFGARLALRLGGPSTLAESLRAVQLEASGETDDWDAVRVLVR